MSIKNNNYKKQNNKIRLHDQSSLESSACAKQLELTKMVIKAILNVSAYFITEDRNQTVSRLETNTKK